MKVNDVSLIFQGLTVLLLFYFLVLTFAEEEDQIQVEQERYEDQKSEKQVTEKILSRKRRLLAFPYGSSFSATICTTIGMYGNPDVNWISFALNFGVSYNLPNETWVVDSAHGFGNIKSEDKLTELPSMSSPSGAELIEKRRTRRDLYNKIEAVIDRMGYNGKQCTLRALCEAAKMFIGEKGTMVEEMVKTVFSYPGRRSFSKEELQDLNYKTDYMYQKAFQKGRSIQEINYCLYYFPNCSFSIVDLAFGRYSVRPATLMQSSSDNLYM